MAAAKWCAAACGWRATNDAGGWQEERCRNAGTPALTGIQIPPDPKMKPQDPRAESITFGVELETTIPATSGVVIGGYHHGAYEEDGGACSIIVSAKGELPGGKGRPPVAVFAKPGDDGEVGDSVVAGECQGASPAAVGAFLQDRVPHLRVVVPAVAAAADHSCRGRRMMVAGCCFDPSGSRGRVAGGRRVRSVEEVSGHPAAATHAAGR
jgi:hypothetical protein